MNALFYMHTRSLKNRILLALRNPKFLAKAFGLLIFIAVIVVGMITGVNIRADRDILVLMGIMFLIFLLPYWAGRFSGGGSFDVEDVNYIFTAPISPRTVLLSGLLRQLGGMLVITVFVMVVLAFASTMFIVSIAHILWAGFFGFVLIAVCKLMGMYLFVAYRKIYRWIGFFWMTILGGFYIFYTARAAWDWVGGLLSLLDSHVFALTPFVGWAAAGAFNFGLGQIFPGLFYMGLLLAAGAYFFGAVYRSNPDFYDEIVDAPVAEPERPETNPKPHETAKDGAYTAISYAFPKKSGARVFLSKHILEASRTSRAGILGTDIIGWIVFAVIWGLYARGTFFEHQVLSAFFIYVGVPSSSFLAPLMPLVFVVSIYPYFDQGFREYSSSYFYLLPIGPGRKLLWISMSRAINVCVTAVLVLGLAGLISGTSPVVVIAAMLAYVSAAFMSLGIRAASVGIFGVLSGAGKTLAATLPVLLFVLIGWIGMMAIFYSGNENQTILYALLGLAGWCLVIGGIGFWYGIKVLHNLDAVG